ncbi:MAG: hypothetical protein PVH40_07505 [Gemmatimonadales bacterium]|jgi:hypothetical protein
MDIGTIIWIAATGTASVWGYVQARRFMRTRLRFVDAAQKPMAPVVAGVAAAAVMVPVVWLLPIVGTGTAVLFGAGVGIGTSQGQKDAKRLPGF